MPVCLCCYAISPDGTFTCPNDGEASWEYRPDPAPPAPTDPVPPRPDALSEVPVPTDPTVPTDPAPAGDSALAATFRGFALPSNVPITLLDAAAAQHVAGESAAPSPDAAVPGEDELEFDDAEEPGSTRPLILASSDESATAAPTEPAKTSRRRRKERGA